MYITWPSTVIAFCFYVSLMVLIVLLPLTVIYNVDTSLLIPRYGRVINCQIQLWTPFVENERCEPLPTALPVFIHWTWCKAASTLLSFAEASGATVLGGATQRWHPPCCLDAMNTRGHELASLPLRLRRQAVGQCPVLALARPGSHPLRVPSGPESL